MITWLADLWVWLLNLTGAFVMVMVMAALVGGSSILAYVLIAWAGSSIHRYFEKPMSDEDHQRDLKELEEFAKHRRRPEDSLDMGKRG